MFKITSTDTPGKCLLRLEGKLLSMEVPALLAACDPSGPPRPLELDLAGLLFADEAGVTALRRLVERGARLSNCSPFIGELLRENLR